MTDTTTRRPPQLGIIRGTHNHPELADFHHLEGSVSRLPTGFQGHETIHIPVIGAPIAGFNVEWNGEIEPHADGTPLAVLTVTGTVDHPLPAPPEPDDEPEPEPIPHRPVPERPNRYQTLRALAISAAAEFYSSIHDTDPDEALETAMEWERWIRTGKDPRTTLPKCGKCMDDTAPGSTCASCGMSKLSAP